MYNTHIMEYYSAINTVKFTVTWMELEGILREMSDIKIRIVDDFTHTLNIKQKLRENKQKIQEQKQITEADNRLIVTKGGGQRKSKKGSIVW